MICNVGDTETRAHAYKTIEVPEQVDCLQGILTVIPLQLLSLHIAQLRNCDVSADIIVFLVFNPSVFNDRLSLMEQRWPSCMDKFLLLFFSFCCHVVHHLPFDVVSPPSPVVSDLLLASSADDFSAGVLE